MQVLILERQYPEKLPYLPHRPSILGSRFDVNINSNTDRVEMMHLLMLH